MMRTEWLDLIEADDWMLEAACLGQQVLFFPPDVQESRTERRERERRAKELCGECVVRVQCLEEALQSGERYGIWGGLTERERRRLTRRPNVRSPQEDIPGPGRSSRLPAVVVQGRAMSTRGNA